MILSYHPCFTGDENLLCAGRQPNAADREIMRTADAVILPQGCSRELYEIAASECPNVFPDYTTRFAFPGKIGQIGLFEKNNIPHPDSICFEGLEHFYSVGGGVEYIPFGFPFVFKFDWSGEGANVMRIDDPESYRKTLQKAVNCERTGQSGFLFQRYVETGGRSLRVAVVGRQTFSYWRVQPDPNCFGTSLSQGSAIDHDVDPDLQSAARNKVRHFCNSTGINLAGFDLIFDCNVKNSPPLFLEINYYFGRRGLGGSNRFYDLFCLETEAWLSERGLAPETAR